MKKAIMMVLTLALCLTVIPTIRADAAVKISKSMATLEVDSILTLKISGSTSKPIWTTSNKSVATVKNGKVTAVAEGQALITATVSEIDYSCSVSVVDSNKAIFDDVLGAGEYLVGVDIPMGKYLLTCTEGAGSITIYKSYEDYKTDRSHDRLIFLATGYNLEKFPSRYSETYKNLSIDEGEYIIIDNGLDVRFHE